MEDITCNWEFGVWQVKFLLELLQRVRTEEGGEEVRPGPLLHLPLLLCE